MEIPDTSASNCRYTEVCRNKTGVFHSQLIFPNPATSYANFSWTSDEAANYTIKLYALNGKEVRAFDGLSALAGKNQYMMDLSSLPPGIYMVILSSDKGDEMHERLVIRE
ncbi:MAG: T9SS type A sorting domain-containing protein [Bacteroidia bacterium]